MIEFSIFSGCMVTIHCLFRYRYLYRLRLVRSLLIMILTHGYYFTEQAHPGSRKRPAGSFSLRPVPFSERIVMKNRRFLYMAMLMAGIVLGLAAGFFALRFYAGHQMEKRGFVPFDSVMKAASYEVRKEDGAEAVCISPGSEHTLTVSSGCTSVDLDGTVYPSEGKFERTLHTLYADRAFLEKLLAVRISKASRFSYTVEEDAAGPGAEGTVTGRQLADLYPPLIAHAGGGFLLMRRDGINYFLHYTNSLEAVWHSLDLGFRAVELDFAPAADGVLCGIHSWRSAREGKVDSAEFLAGKTNEGLTRISFQDALNIFRDQPDVILVLDLKLSRNVDEETVRGLYQTICEMALATGGEALLNRIVPQIYHTWEYDVIREYRDWDNIIFTLYREKDMAEDDVVSFVSDKDDIRIVTLPRSMITGDFTRKLHDAGKKVYTYSVNELSTMRSWQEKGVDGFYTDIVTPEEFG